MIIGIDIGTQSLKAVVTDDNLKVLGGASRAYAVSHPQPGWAEQNPQDWEEALAPAIAEALAQAGAAPSDITALGVAGQLDGCIAVDMFGVPMSPCIIWMDRRAEEEIALIDANLVRNISGNTLDAGHMGAKIRWLKRNVLKTVKASKFHQPVSYLVSKFVGAHMMDHGLASTTMLYSLAKCDYENELLKKFQVDRKQLPALLDAGACAGMLNGRGAELCGLPEGIPVAAGTGDDFSTPLGAGLVSPGRVACVLGTAEVVGTLSETPVIDETGLVETHRYVNGKYFIENPGWLSGGAVAWFVKTFGLKDFDELEKIAGEVPPGADGVTFIPALSGAMSPEWIASARGCFYGLTAAHGAGHMARAVLEGCAFAMLDVVRRFREMDIPVESILLLGGGARSRLWARIRADATGLPVEVPENVDTSQLGAAMLAAVAGKIQPDIETCARLVGQRSVIIEPDKGTVDAYAKAYADYRKLFDALHPIFHSS